MSDTTNSTLKMDNWDGFTYLPFDCALRVYKFLSFKSINELAKYDPRVAEYRCSDAFKHKTATKLQRWFKSRVAFKRAVYMQDNREALRKIHTMTRNIIPKFHTALPKRRVVIRRKDMTKLPQKFFRLFADIICRIQTFPKVRLMLLGNGAVLVDDIPETAVIPFYALPYFDMSWQVHPDDNLPAFICFTEVHLLRRWTIRAEVIECSNIAVRADKGFLVKSLEINKKNPNRNPTPPLTTTDSVLTYFRDSTV